VPNDGSTCSDGVGGDGKCNFVNDGPAIALG
jgi:hypothetical protein